MPRTRSTTRKRAVTVIDIDENFPFTRKKTVWEHLHELGRRKEYEEAILLYEVTNTSTASNRWIVPSARHELEAYKYTALAYELTKRFAQGSRMYKTLIQALPGQQFASPSIFKPRSATEKLSEDDMDLHDQAWFGHVRCLAKSLQYHDAIEALDHILLPKNFEQRDNDAADILLRIKKPETFPAQGQPEEWRPYRQDDYYRSVDVITRPSLYALMGVLRCGSSAPIEVLSNKFSDPVASKDIFYWLKSFEASGKNDIMGAIQCLKKMSHRNARVLTQMAKFYYQLDMRDEARRQLQSAHANDSLWVDGMDMLGFLCMGPDIQDITFYKDLLEEVVSMLQKEWPHRAETYTVAGFAAHQVHLDLACSLANRAMRCASIGSDQYIYAAHLKVFCLRTLELKSRENNLYNEELHMLLNDVVTAMPKSPDLALLFVDTLLEDEEGHREAKLFATKFLHDNQNNVHAKLLKVHVLVNGTTRNPEVNHTTPPHQELFRLLDEITTDFPHILTGFSFLLNEYERLGNLAKCKEIIEKLNASRPLFSRMKTPKFHRLKADYLLKFKEFTPAYHHLMAAIATGDTIDPGTFKQFQMSTYESEIQLAGNVPGNYRNLDFLDPPISESARQSTSVSNSPDSRGDPEPADPNVPGPSPNPQ